MERYVAAKQRLFAQPMYVLKAAAVESVTSNSITLSLGPGPSGRSSSDTVTVGDSTSQQNVSVIFPLTQDVSVYDRSAASTLSSLQKGNTVLFLATTTSHVLTPDNFTVASIFKTQYDVRGASDWIPGVEPLAVYNQLQVEQRQYEQQMQSPTGREK